MKQKLANILKDIESGDKVNDLFKDLNGAEVKKVRVIYDLESGTYQVESLTQDSNGTIEHDYKLNTNTGDVVETIKNITSGNEKIIESHVNMTTIKTPDPVPVNVVAAMNTTVSKTSASSGSSVVETEPVEDEEASSTSSVAPMTWEEIEMQRDVAFKVINFFIVFIIGTFGLIYAYFKLSKKEKLEQERQARAKNIFFGEADQGTFFDFLASQSE